MNFECHSSINDKYKIKNLASSGGCGEEVGLKGFSSLCKNCENDVVLRESYEVILL